MSEDVAALSLLHLPLEIRRLCYKQVFLDTYGPFPVNSLAPLGFRNPGIEAPAPNVFITLPAGVLWELYLSNPAGNSMGKFWKPCKLLGVSKSMAEETQEEWARMLVRVGSWVTFLANRPSHLLTSIQYVQFRYWLRGKWEPRPDARDFHYGIEYWMGLLQAFWQQQLEGFGAMVPAQALCKMMIDLTLIHPPVLTYRITNGFEANDVPLVLEMVREMTVAALLKFEEDGLWPAFEVVVEGPDLKVLRDETSNKPTFDATRMAWIEAQPAADDEHSPIEAT